MDRNEDLTMYDYLSDEERYYYSQYGRHFNKRLCDFAVSLMMRRNPKSGEKEKITPMSRSDVDALLSAQNVRLSHNDLYDATYVCNMVLADMRGSSIEDDKHHALAIKDFMDDEDQYPGMLLSRWKNDCARKGIVIDWERML